MHYPVVYAEVYIYHKNETYFIQIHFSYPGNKSNYLNFEESTLLTITDEFYF